MTTWKKNSLDGEGEIRPVDVEAVLSEHVQFGRLEWARWCRQCWKDHNGHAVWPCLPYRLALELREANEDRERLRSALAAVRCPSHKNLYPDLIPQLTQDSPCPRTWPGDVRMRCRTARIALGQS